jgi:endonuclease/exonuclease/phosphatase family metal-dependent hydrolase
MRIVTWNVYGLAGYPKDVSSAVIGTPGEDANCDHFATVFEQLDADIIAIQEGVTHRAAQNIARRCHRHLATFPSPQNWPGHVLSRFPVVESRTLSHAVGDDSLPRFSRTAGAALLQVSEDEQLWVVCLHLHPGDVELRAREGDLLRDRLETLLASSANAVVLGDFNCDVSEPIHQHLRELNFVNAMERTDGGLQLTMDTADIKPSKIDHIYISASLEPSLSDARVIRDAGFRTDPPRPEGSWDHSDHLPVRADLNWPI